MGMLIAKSMALIVGVVDRSGQMEMHDLYDSWTLPSISKEQAVIIFADSDALIFQSDIFVLMTDNDNRQNRLHDPLCNCSG